MEGHKESQEDTLLADAAAGGGDGQTLGTMRRLWVRFTAPKTLMLTSLLITLATSRSVDYVLYVRMGDKMTNYTWYLSSIVLSVVYLLFSWPIVWYKFKRTDHITPKMTEFPKSIYLVMGTFDSLGNILSTIPVPHVAGPLQIVLSQMIIPINMLGSFLYLHTRYKVAHYLGAITVVAGVVVAIIPMLQGTSSSEPFYVAMLIVSCVPMAASNIYKEQKLKDTDIDIFYFNAWVSTFQLLFGIITAPMVFSSFFVGPAKVEPHNLGHYLLNANKCMGGFSSEAEDACSSMPQLFSIYIWFNITYNLSMLYVFRYGSAVIAVIVSAFRVAMSAFLFEWHFVSGEAYQKLKVYDYAALGILLLGIVLYRSKEEVAATPHKHAKPYTLGMGGNAEAVEWDPDARRDPSAQRYMTRLGLIDVADKPAQQEHLLKDKFALYNTL